MTRGRQHQFPEFEAIHPDVPPRLELTDEERRYADMTDIYNTLLTASPDFDPKTHDDVLLGDIFADTVAIWEQHNGRTLTDDEVRELRAGFKIDIEGEPDDATEHRGDELDDTSSQSPAEASSGIDTATLIRAAKEKSGSAISSVIYFVAPEERDQAMDEIAQMVEAASSGLDYSVYSERILARLRPSHIKAYDLKSTVESIAEAMK